MHRHAHGFTLIELLVAMTVLALLALMSWRGIDGMINSQSRARAHADTLMVLQTALAQWRTDLDAQLLAAQLPAGLPPALDWDGRVLRIVRQAPAGSASPGAIVAAWSRREVLGRQNWLRWQSPLLHTRGELVQAWEQAGQWSQSPGDLERQNETVLFPLDQWEIFYFRGGAWSHPLSSDAATRGQSPSHEPAPDGVRLVLTLPGAQAVSGMLTLDWVRPGFVGPKS